MDFFRSFRKNKSHHESSRKYSKARTNRFDSLFSMFKSEQRSSIEDDISVERINHLDAQASENSHFNIDVSGSGSRLLNIIMDDNDNSNISKIDTLNTQIEEHQKLAEELVAAGNQIDADEEIKRAQGLIEQRDQLIKKQEDEQKDKVETPDDTPQEKTSVERVQEKETKEEPSSLNEVQKQIEEDHFNEVWKNRNEILKTAYNGMVAKLKENPHMTRDEIKDYILSKIPEELRPIINDSFDKVSHMSQDQLKAQIKAVSLQKEEISSKEKEEIDSIPETPPKDKEPSSNENQQEEKQKQKESLSTEVPLFENNPSQIKKESESEKGDTSMNNEMNNNEYNMNNNQAPVNNDSNVITAVEALIIDSIFQEETRLVINERVLRTLLAVKINDEQILLAYKNGTVKKIGINPNTDDFVLASDFNEFKNSLRSMLINSSLVDSDFLVPNRFNIVNN